MIPTSIVGICIELYRIKQYHRCQTDSTEVEKVSVRWTKNKNLICKHQWSTAGKFQKFLERGCINFLLLLQQITKNLVVWNNTHLLSCSSGGQSLNWSGSPSGGSQGESSSLSFPASRACPHSLDGIFPTLRPLFPSSHLLL